MENKKNPKIILDYIRHGEHEQYDKVVPSKLRPLTNAGIIEMSEIGAKLKVNEKQSVAFSADLKRSIASCFLIMNPETDLTNFDLQLEDYLKKGRIKVLEELLYKPTSPAVEFKKELDKAVESKSAFDFMVFNSDRFKETYGEAITSYSDMVHIVAKTVFHYIKVLDNWIAVSSKYKDKELYRIFCGKGYIYPSFRAEITKKILGNAEMKSYVKWYHDAVETNNDGRKITSRINCINDDNDSCFYLEDPYGRLLFSVENIQNILDATQKMGKDNINSKISTSAKNQ